MDSQQADWIARWGSTYGMETRLREVFTNSQGQEVLKWFQKKKLEPDVLAYVLIYWVWPPQTVGVIPEPLPAKPGQRDSARQQAIALLTGYFKDIRDTHSNLPERPPWELITNFLIATGLFLPKKKSKNVASEWRTAVNRAKKPSTWDESKSGVYKFENYQAGLLTSYYQIKDVLEGKTFDQAYYDRRFQDILACLHKYSDG